MIAPLSEVKKIIPGYDGAIGLAGVITKPDGSPRRAYVGLQARDGNDQWVAVHEIGHVLGFADDYGSPNTETVYSIAPGTGQPPGSWTQSRSENDARLKTWRGS